MTVALTETELEQITGYKRQVEQRRWLQAQGWVFSVNAAGRLVVGRWYADQKLAGVQIGRVKSKISLENVP